MKAIQAIVCTSLLGTSLLSADPLYTREGEDVSFAAILESGCIQPGNRFSNGPVLGSRIVVNHELLEKMIGKTGPIPKDIRIHTQGAGSIDRGNFNKWTRWYQEDGSTQVFRLFREEQNVRDGAGEKGSAGRVEAFTPLPSAEPGTWREWECPDSSAAGPPGWGETSRCGCGTGAA
jgi:hypothetical protein